MLTRFGWLTKLRVARSAGAGIRYLRYAGRTFFATGQVFDLPLISLMTMARRIRRRRKYDLTLKNPCTEPRPIASTGGDGRVPATNAHGLQVLCDPGLSPAPSFFFEGTG
jgi:hypothetical protein